MSLTKIHLIAAALLLAALGAQAKLPALSPEAKAKADETKAKTAWTDQVGAYQLCKSMDKTAAYYFKTSGKDAKSATATPPCTDPGPFLYTPEAAPAGTPPLEAAGAHSPAQTTTGPPNSKETDAQQKGGTKK